MSVRDNPLEEGLHMPGADGCNLCDGRPYQTRLLRTDPDHATTYPLCQRCWDAMMGGAQVGAPQPIDTAAAPPPKEIPHAAYYDEATEAAYTRRPVVRARAERLDQPRDGR